MTRYLLVTFSDPKDPAKEKEFNDWYDNMHMPDMLKTPGLLKGSRWMSADKKENEIRKYLSVYELETDNLDEFNAMMRQQGMWTMKAGRFPDLGMYDADNVPRIYVQITEEKKGTPWSAAKTFKPGNKAAAKAPAKKPAAEKPTAKKQAPKKK
jgi:hypothetical protein